MKTNEYPFGTGYPEEDLNLGRPTNIDHKWADAVVDEWFDVYKRFLDEAEAFVLKHGTDKIEIKNLNSIHVLRSFAIRFI